MDQNDRPVEIKDLNKTQLILLAILLSFVVSIATGIVTVTLMQQAPTGFTQTVNRVVQQTIEKVSPDYSPNKVQTVVVKEDDLVVDAVTKTRSHLYPLYTSKDATSSIGEGYSIGGGQFITSSSALDTTHTYSIKVGTTYAEAKVTAVSPLGFAFLTTTDTTIKLTDLPTGTFGKDSDSKSGQTAVIVSMQKVGKAIVQSISSLDPTSKNSPNVIDLSPEVAMKDDGTFVVNLEGDVIGLVLAKNDTTEYVIASDAVQTFIKNPPVDLTQKTL
ncbi:MAG: hypothetical protein WCG55_01795 [bacterium]